VLQCSVTLYRARPALTLNLPGCDLGGVALFCGVYVGTVMVIKDYFLFAGCCGFSSVFFFCLLQLAGGP